MRKRATGGDTRAFFVMVIGDGVLVLGGSFGVVPSVLLPIVLSLGGRTSYYSSKNLLLFPYSQRPIDFENLVLS